VLNRHVRCHTGAGPERAASTIENRLGLLFHAYCQDESVSNSFGPGRADTYARRMFVRRTHAAVTAPLPLATGWQNPRRPVSRDRHHRAQASAGAHRLLLNALGRRVKNTLTMQFFAIQALRNTFTFKRHLGIRGTALALSKAHDVLRREHWAGAGEQPKFRLRWSGRGGPPLAAPEQARRRLSPRFGATVRIHCNDGRVIGTIGVPPQVRSMS